MTKKKALCIINTKGGTGKTLISLNLGKRLSKFGKTALLDVDLDNSSFSQFTGIDGVIQVDKEQSFEPFNWEGMEVFSMSLVTARDQSVSMKGDRYVQIIDDVITRSKWSADFFVFDMPGGSSDIFRSVIEVLDDILVGNVIIHQPAMVDSTRKILGLHEYLGIPVLGIIENMSYFDTGHGKVYDTVIKAIKDKKKKPRTKGSEQDLGELQEKLQEELAWLKDNSILYPFGPSTVEEIAQEYNVSVLGKIPLDPHIAHRFSEGNPFLDESVLAPIDATIDIFLKTEPSKPRFLTRLKEKVSDIVHRELIKVMAGLLTAVNKTFDIKSMRDTTGFTQDKPFLFIITDKNRNTLTRIGMQITEKGVMVIKENRGFSLEEYQKWVEETFEYRLDCDYQTLARIIMGKKRQGKDEIPFSAWSAWLNGDLEVYGLGHAPRATNAIRNIFENEAVIGTIRESYGKILSRWI